MFFAISRHHPLCAHGKLDEKGQLQTERVAERLLRSVGEMGLKIEPSNTIILSSPEDRAIATAAVFGEVLGAGVEQYAAFGNILGDNELHSSEGMRKVHRASEAARARFKDYGLVVVATHRPMVQPLFSGVIVDHKRLHNGPTVPDLWFGFHLVNLGTMQYESHGVLQ